MTAESGPRRIQRKRTKGWRLPPGAVIVSRPTKWGNPFKRDPMTARAIQWEHADGTREDYAVGAFRSLVRLDDPDSGYPTIAEIRHDLAGKDLACWCPLTDADGDPFPCHADVLLAIANGP